MRLHHSGHQRSQDADALIHQGASAATKRGAPICYDFVKGMCSRGAECRYSHDIGSVIHGSKGRVVAAGEPCFDFLRCGWQPLHAFKSTDRHNS